MNVSEKRELVFFFSFFFFCIDDPFFFFFFFFFFFHCHHLGRVVMSGAHALAVLGLLAKIIFSYITSPFFNALPYP